MDIRRPESLVEDGNEKLVKKKKKLSKSPGNGCWFWNYRVPTYAGPGERAKEGALQAGKKKSNRNHQQTAGIFHE